MNHDSIFVAIRYLLIAAGAIMVGAGWASSDTWAQFMRGWDLLGGALVVLLPAAWGLWINWNTRKVSQETVDRRSLSTVDAATGAIKKPE